MEEQQQTPPAPEATPEAEVAASAEAPAELEALRAQASANMEGWQRERAEFSNYKKRAEQQLRDAQGYGAADALKKLLPILDDFARAMANVPAELQEHPWVTGTAMILRKFDKTLDELSVQALDPLGQPFDPRTMEAIGTDAESDAPSGTVTSTLQRGYLSGERVIRPALVRVAP